MSNIILHPGQSQVFRDLFVDKTVINAVTVCSRGFGKSFLGATAAVQAAWELMELPAYVPNKLVTVIAPTYAQVTDIYYNLIIYQLGVGDYAIKPSKDTGRIPLPNNVELRLVSYEAIDRLRGLGIYFTVNDETRDWTSGGGFKDAWESVLEPCISTRWGKKRALELGACSPGRSLTITTPKGFDYTYDMYNRHELDSSYKSYHFDYKQSPLLDIAEVERLRHLLDPIKFAREYKASFEDSGNNVFYCFNRGLHVLRDIADFDRNEDGHITEDLHIGIDFNVNIQASSVAVIRGGTIFWVDEFRGSADTETLCMAVKGRYWPLINGVHKKTCKINVYPDASGNARKTSSPVGVTDLAILRSHGFNVLAHSKQPAIVDSVACVNRMLKSAAGDIRMYVHAKCKHLITSLERTQWVENNADTATIDKREGVEHSSDGIRYLTEFLFPIRAGIKTTTRGFGF